MDLLHTISFYKTYTYIFLYSHYKPVTVSVLVVMLL